MSPVDEQDRLSQLMRADSVSKDGTRAHVRNKSQLRQLKAIARDCLSAAPFGVAGSLNGCRHSTTIVKPL